MVAICRYDFGACLCGGSTCCPLGRGTCHPGFAPIEPDNRRILTQEWLAEAFTMWGLAAIVVAATLSGSGTSVAAWVYRAGAGLLVGLAFLTAVTGARTPVIWFKICPVLLTTSAVLLLAASFL